MRRLLGAATETAEVRRAVARHLLYGALALVVVSVPTFVTLSNIAEQHALDGAAVDGASIARRLLAPAVTDDLVASEAAAIAAMDRRLVPRMSDGSLARVKIWAPDGRIVYSDEHRLIGRNFVSDLDLSKLRPGGPPLSAISDLEEDENIYETAPQGLVEVYTMSTSASGRDMVYEMYFPLDRVQRERNQLVAQMAPVLLVALGALALSQLPLAVGLARTVSTIRRSRLRLLAQTVRAVELERRRLAQDLHDDVIQDLSGVAVTLESYGRQRGSPPEPSVQRAAEVLRRDVRLLRDIVANLFPTTAPEAGLDIGIRELAAAQLDPGVRVELDLDRDQGIDPVTAGLLYRVARESIVNVSKHADASWVQVRLQVRPDAVALEVADDGRGQEAVPAHRIAGHVGLDIVRETIEEAGGTVTVENRSPRGTTVRAHLPR